MDLPDTSYRDNDRELLASPDPSMRRGILPSSGPRPSRQSQQNVLVVQTAGSAAPGLLPASPGNDVEEVDDDGEKATAEAPIPQLSVNVGHVSSHRSHEQQRGQTDFDDGTHGMRLSMDRRCDMMTVW